LVCFQTICIAQTDVFELTPSGLRSTKDTSKNYIVIDLPGKSKAEIFKQTQIFMNRSFVSPKDVMSIVEGESVTITGYAEKEVHRTNNHVFNTDYTMTFEFKDGKMKISSPAIKLTTTFYQKPQTLYLVANNSITGDVMGIWNEKLKLKSLTAKTDIENYFNSFISRLIKYFSEKNDW
jgi:hypothetical protein